MIDWVEIPTTMVKNPLLYDAVPGVPLIVPAVHRHRVMKGRVVQALCVSAEFPEVLRLYFQKVEEKIEEVKV